MPLGLQVFFMARPFFPDTNSLLPSSENASDSSLGLKLGQRGAASVLGALGVLPATQLDHTYALHPLMVGPLVYILRSSPIHKMVSDTILWISR